MYLVIFLHRIGEQPGIIPLGRSTPELIRLYVFLRNYDPESFDYMVQEKTDHP